MNRQERIAAVILCMAGACLVGCRNVTGSSLNARRPADLLAMPESPALAPVVPNPPASAPAAPNSPAQARCEAENEYPKFRNCPHWRVAMPDECGRGPGPSFMDPCRCMCDLCESDGDCTAKPSGTCIALSSAACGGYDQKVCVYEGDPCHPARHCPKRQSCYNYSGSPHCEPLPSERLCDR
jgi:hypothetical protein